MGTTFEEQMHQYVEGLIHTYERAWIDQWRMLWRQGCYQPYPEFFMRKLDEIIRLEADLRGYGRI